MAENIKYRFIQNVGDFFPAGYFGEDFIDKVQKIAGYSTDQINNTCSQYVQFRRKYDDYKNRIVSQVLRPKDVIRYTHEFHTELLKLLGYKDMSNPYSEQYILDDEKYELIPVRHVLRRNDKVQMLIMEMRPLIKVGDEEPAGLFEQQYDDESQPNKPSRFTASHWSDVFTMPEGYRISPAVVNKAISRIFLMPENRRPAYILMLAGNTVFFFDQEKWNRGCYLAFSLDDLFSQASISAFRKYYALFHMLVCKETLSPEGETVMMSSLVEDSYKNAYEVTKDLKEGVVNAVETLANEALWYMKRNGLPYGKYNQETNTYDETDDAFEAEVKDDCLTIVYRLLFLFYAESRTELEILPVDDEVYEHGYSLEMLRDLEQVRLISEESKSGYFFDASIKHLFYLLSHGHKENQDKKKLDKSFRVRHIDSPMFDDSKLHHLGNVKFRNAQWQNIICALSLSKKKQGKGRGRISYSNLGVNQLGSVYESLLAYRGFYAEEDYIEVHKENCPEDGTFLVPYSRMDDFKDGEILHKDDGTIEILPKGTFVYRLNGRDRQKSASYYTPEVLTRSTVKYTLKGILDDVQANIDKLEQLKANDEDTSGWSSKALELLNLKILEPAMGAAAFQNEVINQVAEAYLKYRSAEKRALKHSTWRIEPDHYRDELQKVKAYIATKNVYGVDLNPTAIELGKLSLWLNVIHKDMETPFFGHRIALGNAVIGAWFKVYDVKQIYEAPKRKGESKLVKWWESAPHKIHFDSKKKRVCRKDNEIYHFLLPDKAMLACAGIKDLKDRAKAEKTAYDTALANLDQELPSKKTYDALAVISKRINDWTKALTGEEVQRLRNISKAIDILIVKFTKYQIQVDKLTANNFTVWGKPVTTTFDNSIGSYEEKQKLSDLRNTPLNEHHTLKVLMDYWCSLWFWEWQDASQLPTRLEYWDDIERIIGAKTIQEAKESMEPKVKLQSSRVTNGMEDMFAPKTYVIDFDTADNSHCEEDIDDENQESEQTLFDSETQVEDKQTMAHSLHETYAIANEQTSQGKVQLDIFKSTRINIVERLSNRYHFFHPMLEFLEVFWLRDGFDVICGNPPWLKLEFDEQGILSEKYPEVAIRKVSAPDARKMRDQMFAQLPTTEELYRSEETDTACSSAFMNGYCNYPLLVGQQTNLYKCVLENGFSMMNNSGFMGLLHPETVYDDPKGQPLRKEIYHRLIYHFQYRNEFSLFAEVGHTRTYGESIYGTHKNNVSFISMNNIFHPRTIDASFIHVGEGLCGGIKQNGKWNSNPHKDRLIHITEKELRALSEAYEDGNDWESVKFVSMHSIQILNVIEKFALCSNHVKDYTSIISDGLHETTAVDNGYVRRISPQDIKTGEHLVMSGPNIYVSTPIYKVENSNSRSADSVILSSISDNFELHPNYVQALADPEFSNFVKSFENDNKKWIDHYKLAYRLMIDCGMERTLIGSIISCSATHISSLISIIFRDDLRLIELTGLSSSIVYDFYIKSTNKGAIYSSGIESLPLGISDIYKPSLFSRTLLLNCLTTAYADLWHEMWNENYKHDLWSITDPRLKSFDTLHDDWSWDIPLRNYFERRQALVEIDVISAMALGLSLEDLEMIYTIQFPVLQQNEDDTWYDQKGNIVFTCSKGLTGVGLDRKGNKRALGWEDIRGTLSEDGLTYDGNGTSHTHIIDPAKSELYGGQEVTYYPPYTKCDRIQDYRRAWAHFDKIFNQ